MRYLDIEKLTTINSQDFQHASPYPWMGMQGLLTPDGFERLRKEYPSLEQFRLSIGEQRVGGQKPHDRYELRSETHPTLSTGWQEFLRELDGKEYRTFLKRMFGVKDFGLRFQWQVSLPDSSVSPHTDGRLKIGNHLFYFNVPEDWNESWGGALEIYDSHQQIPWNTSPTRESFARIESYPILNNRSVIFGRNDHSWHGVATIKAPEGSYRKLFTVVIDKPRPFKMRIKDFLFNSYWGTPKKKLGASVINMQ